MGRPAKATAVSSGKTAKSERKKRAAIEDTLKGDNSKIMPPDWLDERQAEIFNFIKNEIDKSGILGNVDTFVLTSFSIAVSRLETIEKTLNLKPELLEDKELMAAKSKYTKDFETGIKELSLSPQARAKMGSLNIAKDKEEADPVLRLLKGKK